MVGTTRVPLIGGLPPILTSFWIISSKSACSTIFDKRSFLLSLSHFLLFPPWVSTSSNLGFQDCAINGTTMQGTLNHYFKNQNTKVMPSKLWHAKMIVGQLYKGVWGNTCRVQKWKWYFAQLWPIVGPTIPASPPCCRQLELGPGPASQKDSDKKNNFSKSQQDAIDNKLFTYKFE